MKAVQDPPATDKQNAPANRGVEDSGGHRIRLRSYDPFGLISV
jgi:hypothetical protein